MKRVRFLGLQRVGFSPAMLALPLCIMMGQAEHEEDGRKGTIVLVTFLVFSFAWLITEAEE